MQISTIVKAGSLFFNVIQDEKIRELAKIAHNGAKRRGMFNDWQADLPTQKHIPFAPTHYRRLF